MPEFHEAQRATVIGVERGPGFPDHDTLRFQQDFVRFRELLQCDRIFFCDYYFILFLIIISFTI